MGEPVCCDVCAGSGLPVSGKPCICGGTGWSQDEKVGLRRKVHELELQIEELKVGEKTDAAMLELAEHYTGDFWPEDVQREAKEILKAAKASTLLKRNDEKGGVVIDSGTPQTDEDWDRLRSMMIENRVKEIDQAGRNIKQYLVELRAMATEAKVELTKVEKSIARLENMAAKLSTHVRR